MAARDALTLDLGGREVRVTNPDKVYFPERGLTKGDLVAHYVEHAARVLPHVAGRPMLMKRFPNGAAADFFYQKRVPDPHPDWLETVRIVFPRHNRTADFPVVRDVAGLAWIANLGCIDLNVWPTHVETLELPDYLLIDLDPTDGNPWSHVREIALVVREVTDELGLPSFPKTSGATGLHILVPIEPELGFKDVRRCAKAIAEEVERRIDDQAVATTTWKVADRVGVFVDFGQNARDRTIASAYSIRPTADARASAPLVWDEVATVEPEAFTLETMPARVEAVGDPSAGMDASRVSLVPCFAALGIDPPTVAG
jgi:bifunctional non-homologous end joining protein LigD